MMTKKIRINKGKYLVDKKFFSAIINQQGLIDENQATKNLNPISYDVPFFDFEKLTKMKDKDKTKDKLIEELVEMRQRIEELESLKIESKRVEALRMKDNALESCINAIAISDLEGNLTYVNPSFLKIWGYDDKEVLGRSAAKFWQVEENAAHIIQTLKQERSWIGELVAKRKDGTFFDVQISASMVTDREGRPVGMMSSFIDITERKKIEEALQESEEKYRTLIENTNDIVFSANEEGQLTYVSPQVKRLGMTPEEVISIDIFEFILSEDRERVLRDFQHTMMTGEEFPTEFRMKDKEGGIHWFEDIGRVQRDASGKIVGLIGVLREITEHKKADEALKQHQQMLEDSERELKNFSRRILSIREEEKKRLSTVLHDEVGATAVALSSSLSDIEEDIKNNNLVKALGAIAKSKSVLLKCISMLKRIAVDLRPADLDIVGLPGSLKEYFSEVKKQTKIKIYFRQNIDKKRVPDNMTIVLYRIIQEAFNNIIKHSKADKVKVGLYSRRNEIRLNISDNGKGFDIKKIQKRARMTIGLRGMKEMAESLEGTFNIKSEPGEGAEISVILPKIKKRRL